MQNGDNQIHIKIQRSIHGSICGQEKKCLELFISVEANCKLAAFPRCPFTEP